jgi:hypothetical protein
MTNESNHNHRPNPLLIGMTIAACGILVFACVASWWGIALSVQAANVANLLAPLFLASAFIERAAEVVITPWRDPGYNDIRAKLTAASAANPPNAAQVNALTQELSDYVAETTRYAFIVVFFFGLVAAMIGIRALSPFLGKPLEGAISDAGQRETFIIFDVVLSAALLAGGSNGIHSIVDAVTSFFDASAQKMQNTVNPGAPISPSPNPANPPNGIAPGLIGGNPPNAPAAPNPPNLGVAVPQQAI